MLNDPNQLRERIEILDYSMGKLNLIRESHEKAVRRSHEDIQSHFVQQRMVFVKQQIAELKVLSEGLEDELIEAFKEVMKKFGSRAAALDYMLADANKELVRLRIISSEYHRGDGKAAKESSKDNDTTDADKGETIAS